MRRPHSLSCHTRATWTSSPGGDAVKVLAVRITSLADLADWLRADLSRYGRSTARALVKEPQVRWLVRLRVTEYLVNRTPRPVAAIGLWRLQAHSVRLGFTIPVNVCGPGLKLPHWGTIVLSPAARVGGHATIHPGVTLGLHHGRAPVVGERVYLGPGSKAWGAVTIGDDVTLGANCVVTKPVAAGTTVVGIPARPI
jgi:serine O-acetyltransferase